MNKKTIVFFITGFLTFAVCFSFFPRGHHVIDLSTGAGLAQVLRYEDAQVYFSGEEHRKKECLQFRNQLFQYLVKEKGVRVLVTEHGYTNAFLENETVQGRLDFSSWYDRCQVTKEDYELYQWMASYNQGKEEDEKLSIVGIDITDNVGTLCVMCQYLIADSDLSAADAQVQQLLQSIQKVSLYSELSFQKFQEELLPQLINLWQNRPEQLQIAFGDKAEYLNRALLMWQEQETLRKQENGLSWREGKLYENFQWAYQQHPDAKYYGSFGAAHVQLSNYAGDVTRLNDSFVTQLNAEDSFVKGKVVAIDGAVSYDIGDLSKSDTNRITLYNTACAKNPYSNSGKFYEDAPNTPDTAFAQYVLLYEHPRNLTESKEYSGSYWKHH